MNKRTFFTIALLLAIVALIIHSVARGFLDDAMHYNVAHIKQAMETHTKYTPDAENTRLARNYNLLTAIGVALTVLSAMCMITAMARHEAGWYLILILILFFDVGAAMLL